MPAVTEDTRLVEVLPAKQAATFTDSLGMVTVGDLIRYAPRAFVKVGELDGPDPEPGEFVTMVAEVRSAGTISTRRGAVFKVSVHDGRRSWDISFFHKAFAERRSLVAGARVLLSGKVGAFRGQLQLSHPRWALVDDEIEAVTDIDVAANERAARLGLTDSVLRAAYLPIYSATSKVDSWEIGRAVRLALSQLAPVVDPIPQRYRAGMDDLDTALRALHDSGAGAIPPTALQRLKFDEALAMQLSLARARAQARAETGLAMPHVAGGLEDRLRERLPFELTSGQETVGAEIAADLGSTSPMSRLLQGEVGSGKTLVSVLAMLRAIDNGYQCALLAPTEVLAAQHYRTITALLGELGNAGELGAAPGATAVRLLTGSLRTAAKRGVLLDVVSGVAGIVIGTHALLSDTVEFFNLGLVVVDEQHRFGVEQRDLLRSKAAENITPDLLVMTATPIPRTVAMSIYGDLETSTLRELPRGRQPITTSVVSEHRPAWVERVWERVAEEIRAGRQIYVVCPKIGDTSGRDDNPDGPDGGKAVLEQYEELLASPLGEFRIGLLHGQLPAEERGAVMDDFASGTLDILVATTVIEVGVDVPNATTMVIRDAERFGISQLHQLRGRVGRGGHPGLCLLMTATNLDGAGPASGTAERLRAVEASHDGFALSLADLEHRREGDVLGVAQSGTRRKLHYLSLVSDGDLIAGARTAAQEIVAADPDLTAHPGLAELVSRVVGADEEYLEKS